MAETLKKASLSGQKLPLRPRNWPLEKFRALADKLGQVMPVRWCAGNEDPPLSDAARIYDLL